MTIDRMAVLADIHGNRWALEAVMEDMRRRKIEHAVNLGDSLYGPLDPGGTADILLEMKWPAVSGNQDRIIVESGDTPATLAFVKSQLNPEHIAWLRSLKPTMVVLDNLFLCHGQPTHDELYLLQDGSGPGVRSRSEEEVGELVADVEQEIILCGHDHTPGQMMLQSGQLVVNPGSVGLQAYGDEFPQEHIIESGSPDARYCILSQSGGEWQVEPVVVPYYWQAAAKVAEQNGRSDWVSWLTTGRARLE